MKWWKSGRALCSSEGKLWTIPCASQQSQSWQQSRQDKTSSFWTQEKPKMSGFTPRSKICEKCDEFRACRYSLSLNKVVQYNNERRETVLKVCDKASRKRPQQILRILREKERSEKLKIHTTFVINRPENYSSKEMALYGKLQTWTSGARSW